MNETTRQRSSRMGRFLTVAAVLFGIVTTTYTQLLPKKITLPQFGIAFEIPSPAALSWRGYSHHPEIIYAKGTGWMWRDDDDEAKLVVTRAVCYGEQMPCTHDDVFDYLVQHELAEGADGRYSGKVLVYLVPVGLDDFVYSTTKDGCEGSSWCAYRWRSGDQPVFIRNSGAMPIEHDVCDVVTRTVKINSGTSGELFFMKTYASIQCDGAHVLMDISNTPQDEIEAIIASVSVLE